jgi:hypothetical protein
MYWKLVKLFILFSSFFKSLFYLGESFKGLVDLIVNAESNYIMKFLLSLPSYPFPPPHHPSPSSSLLDPKNIRVATIAPATPSA